MQSDKLSRYLVQYLSAVKRSEKNEVYETILLMMLNNDFVKALNKLVLVNVKSIKQNKNILKFEVHSSKEYEEIVDLICESKYFLDNFNKTEIERKKVIAKNIIVEIALQSAVQSTDYFKNNDVKVNASFGGVMYPNINHKLIGGIIVPKIQLTFNDETPLDDVIKYLKEVLKLKNIPKKKKLFLGQGFRILQISNEIKDKTLNYKKQKYEYNEQVIAREMFNRYKEKVSMEAVSKSLQRIKKIKKEVNTFTDK